MAEYPVVEIFESVNGEGPRTGQLSLFVRMRGCNLRCTYCDTAWANDDKEEVRYRSLEDILETVRQSGIRNVTLTGGEPLFQENMEDLLHALLDNSWVRIEVETNGSIAIAPFLAKLTKEERKRLSFTMDYKLPGSGMEERMRLSNFSVLCAWDTVKFVVSDRADLTRARELIAKYRLTETCRVYLSPVFGVIDPREIVAYMKDYRMNDVSLQLQLHKVIWNPSEHGV